MKHANRSDFDQLQDNDADLEKRVQALARELDAALEQQTATSEVLRAIRGRTSHVNLKFAA